MRVLIRSMQNLEPKETESVPKNYELILTQAHLDEWIQRLEQAAYFAFDTETTSLNYMQARIVGFSFCG